MIPAWCGGTIGAGGAVCMKCVWRICGVFGCGCGCGGWTGGGMVGGMVVG